MGPVRSGPYTPLATEQVGGQDLPRTKRPPPFRRHAAKSKLSRSSARQPTTPALANTAKVSTSGAIAVIGAIWTGFSMPIIIGR